MSAAAPRFVCVVLHDAAAATQAGCERVMRAAGEVAPGLPWTLLVVPRYHGGDPTPAFERWLAARSAAGDELSLHGWRHLDERPPSGPLDALRRRHYTRGEGEFWALPRGEAAARIAAGRAWLDGLGLPAPGFVAPAWLLGPGAQEALEATDFAYTSTLRTVRRLPRGPVLASQSLVYSTSSAWRRALSLAWNAAVARAERGNPLLRLELHPRDADFPRVRRSWQRLLGAALADGRRPATVSQALDALAPAPPRGALRAG